MGNAEPPPVVDPPDPMLVCEWKVVTEDPVHPGETVVLYYPAMANVPIQWKPIAVKLKAKGVKEPKEKVT